MASNDPFDPFDDDADDPDDRPGGPVEPGGTGDPGPIGGMGSIPGMGPMGGMGSIPGMGGMGGMEGMEGMDLNAMLNSLLSSLGSVGGDGEPDTAHLAKLAASIATEGQPEANIDPAERIRIETLARVAELHVTEITGLSLAGVEVSAVNRSQWAETTLKAHGPLLRRLSNALSTLAQGQLDQAAAEGPPSAEDLPDGVDPAMFGAFMAMGPIMGSMLYTMMASGTVGQLAIRSFGSYDLPLPRHTDEVNLIASNLDSFATEWELERDDLVLWITTQELALHAALSRAAFGPQLEALLGAYVDASPTDLSTDAIRSMLGQDDSDPLGSDFDPNQFDPSNLAISPERLLGSLRSPEQEALRPRIDAAVAALEGWSGWVTDTVAERLMPGSSRVAEALRRRRVSVDPASRFVERLFGLELTQDVMDRGRVFVRGVLERADADVLTRLVTDPEAIPTPNELEAPGLWLARLGVEPDGGPEPDSDSLDVPDFPDL